MYTAALVSLLWCCGGSWVLTTLESAWPQKIYHRKNNGRHHDVRIQYRKIDIYKKLVSIMPAEAILATNSSTLLPSMFSAETGRPDRFAALHFANMIWALNIAEIMGSPETSDNTLARLTAYAVEIGMVPISISREQNGCVCNSLLVPLLQAAQSLVTKGVADHETVDRTYMIMNRDCTMGRVASWMWSAWAPCVRSSPTEGRNRMIRICLPMLNILRNIFSTPGAPV